ncbi:hypothetical protein Goshw_022813 [Gossypium schwendimanii]|uniref:Uncharacterized protein n=1 Tax=Gossypium schwendimanii TaxID=34291 RepID=A0A7J9KU39_GOSSC|nr:hypothetical protein [Gossypium schwendimanii]
MITILPQSTMVNAVVDCHCPMMGVSFFTYRERIFIEFFFPNLQEQQQSWSFKEFVKEDGFSSRKNMVKSKYNQMQNFSQWRAT